MYVAAAETPHKRQAYYSLKDQVAQAELSAQAKVNKGKRELAHIKKRQQWLQEKAAAAAVEA